MEKEKRLKNTLGLSNEVKVGEKETKEDNNMKEECFVIMPISDQDGYGQDHFSKVYTQIIKPAVEEAGYICKRADEEVSTHLIHLTIIQKLIEAPMAICDLSSKNPNVMFELGIRQAFNKPVVLIQDEKTPRIFDVSTLNTITYDSSREYDCVVASRRKIVEAIDGNMQKSESLISLMKLLPATINDVSINTDADKLNVILAMISDLSSRINYYESSTKYYSQTPSNEKMNTLVRRAKDRISLLRMRINDDSDSSKFTSRIYDEIVSTLKECEDLEMILRETINEVRYRRNDSILSYRIFRDLEDEVK